VPADLRHTAALHRRELPLGVFVELGARFLARWHRAYLDSPHGVALVAIEYPVNGRPRLIGFLIGAADRAGFRHDLLIGHRSGLARRGLVGLLLRPHLLTRLRGLARPRPRSGSARVGELAAVAVAADVRRLGVGHDLVEAYLRDCAAAGADWVELTAPAACAEAHAFCTRTGWMAIGEEADCDGGHARRFGRLT
jgi:GNAT superfamily N-acetyltransferase